MTELFIICPTWELKREVANLLAARGYGNAGYSRECNGALRVNAQQFTGFWARMNLPEMVQAVRRYTRQRTGTRRTTASQVLADPNAWIPLV